MQHVQCNIALMCCNINKLFISCYRYSSELYKNASWQATSPLSRVPESPKKLLSDTAKSDKKFLYLAISFICHIIHECSSQWDLYDSEEVGQSVGRSQSLPPSKISWSVGRKACRQVKSVGRTYGRLVITLVGHKVGRSYGRSVIRSVGHKVGRS